MPPKNKHKNESKRAQANRVDVVAIEQELSRQENDNSVPEILRKLEVTYKQHKESLNHSLLQMILRLCGLSEIIPRLAQSSSMESIAGYVQEIEQKKFTINQLPVLINSKDKFHKQFIQRLSLFFSKLISNDFPYMKEQNQTKFLETIRHLLVILSKSPLRNIRYAAVYLIKIIIQSELAQYALFIREKQSRYAFEFCKDVQLYLRSNIKLRLKDIDSKIRQTMQTIIKKAFMTMETDLVDEPIIQELFLPVLQESNAKLIQSSLSSISSFIAQSKKLKTLIIDFVMKHPATFQKTSLIPNRNGNLALKILVAIQKQYPQRSLLNPGHISRIFEFYSIQKYSVGLSTAIEAFYHSIYSDEQELFANKSNVLIEIVNLINNYQSRGVKQAIINSFFQYYRVPCQKIFSFEQIITIILSQEYSFQNSQINISDKQIQGWFEIAYLYAKYVKQKIQRYESLDQQKYKQELTKWNTIAQTYNNIILVNIKQIYHKILHKRAAWFVKYNLQLIRQLFMPISSNYEKHLQYLLEKMINLFETETNSMILKQIVDIFFNLKSFNFQALTSHFDKPNNFTPQVFMIKKLCILGRFYVQDYVNTQFLNEILKSYKKSDAPFIKIQYLVGLYVVHQWYVNSLLDNPIQRSKMQQYKNLQAQIVRFLFALLTTQENEEVKFAGFNILCNLLSIVCNDQIQDVPQMYYSVSEQEMNFIYKFLDKEIGLPRLEDDQAGDKSSLQLTRIIGSLGNFSVDKQKSIKKLFELLSSSFRISSLPQSIEIILATLIKENTSVDMDQSVSRINKTFDFGNADLNNIFARERLATKYFQHLIEQEILPANVSKFIYWQIFTSILKFKTSSELKERLITRILDIYLKKKFTKQQNKQSLNKALLFVIAELDRIQQQQAFKDLHFILLLLKKFVKRIANEVFHRVLAFYRNKYQNQFHEHDEADQLLKFLEKQCKAQKPEEDKDDQEEDKENQQQENKEQNQREMMKPRGRQTRSSNKRGLRS